MNSRQPTAQPLHAQRLLVIAAQVFLEGHVLEPDRALAQGMLLIGLPEEARIVEAGTQHAFMSVANDALRIAIGVQHGEKMRQQLAARIFDGKIFLMIAHDRDQNFLGQFQKFGIEAAQNHRRPLGEVDDCIEQSLVFAPARAGDRFEWRRRGPCESASRARRGRGP